MEETTWNKLHFQSSGKYISLLVGGGAYCVGRTTLEVVQLGNVSRVSSGDESFQLVGDCKRAINEVECCQVIEDFFLLSILSRTLTNAIRYNTDSSTPP